MRLIQIFVLFKVIALQPLHADAIGDITELKGYGQVLRDEPYPAILDFDILGAIQFTLMFGANSAAKDTVSPSIAPLADETILWLVKPLLTATVENKTIEPLFCFKLSDALLIISIAEIKFKLNDCI